jgi:hypothetical protein
MYVNDSIHVNIKVEQEGIVYWFPNQVQSSTTTNVRPPPPCPRTSASLHPIFSPAPPSSLALPPLQPYAPPPLRLASSPHPRARAFLSATIHVAAPSPSSTDLAAQISRRPLLLLLRRRHSRPHPVCARPPERLGHESTCTCLPDHHAAAPSLPSTTLAAWIPRWPPLLLHHNHNRPPFCLRPADSVARARTTSSITDVGRCSCFSPTYTDVVPLSLEEGKPYEFSGMENWAPWLPFTTAPIALPPLSGEQNDTSPVISSPRAHPIFSLRPPFFF